MANNPKVYLVLIGDEYGFNILNQGTLKFLTLEEAEETYLYNINEYGISAMFKLDLNEMELILIKEENINN